MKYTFLILTAILVFSCSSSREFKNDKPAFEAANVLQRFKSVADMNDAYFVIKENNFFEFYKVLYDSVKNTSYPGKFEKSGDTLLLHFYNTKGYTLLGHKALISPNNKEIVFFDNFPGHKKGLIN